MRIVYIIDSLASKGGAERIISEKMSYLATIYNYDVSVITCYQFPETMPNRYYVSEKVKQINLRIPEHHQYRYKYPMRLWAKWRIYRKLCKELTNTINSIDPDIIIGVGYVLANIVCRIKCRAAKVIESHSARLYTKSSLRYRNIPRTSKAYIEFYRNRYLHAIEKYADVVVTLTKGDAYEWRNARRVVIIPNFSMMPIQELSNCENKRVIAVGRLMWQKGYDRLIDIWKIITKKHPDWQLDIYGEGPLKTEIQNNIKEAGLSNVFIHPFTQDISIEYAKSSICVLTARFEGFSLVLLEAMRHGIPCVAFDCPFGPKDLIDHEKCGFIIENGNNNLFADRLCYLTEHTKIRKQFGNAAIAKSQAYNVDAIMKKWKLLFESMVTKSNEKED